MWQSSSLQTKVPSGLTWAIVGLDTEFSNIMSTNACWINIKVISYYQMHHLLDWQSWGQGGWNMNVKMLFSNGMWWILSKDRNLICLNGHGNHECVASIFGFCKTLILARISNVMFAWVLDIFFKGLHCTIDYIW
jgi:hypothetical protein